MFRAAHKTPFAIPPECDSSAVECLDAVGRPLLVTPRPQRTGLVRVYAGVLCCAPGKRVHVRRVVPEDPLPDAPPRGETPGWTLSAYGPVLAAEAREDTVWRLLLAEPYWKTLLAPFVLPELLPLETLEPVDSESFFPSAHYGLTRFCLFKARMPVVPAGTDDHLWLDPSEVRGLAEQFPGLFSPLLNLALSLFQKK